MHMMILTGNAIGAAVLFLAAAMMGLPQAAEAADETPTTRSIIDQLKPSDGLGFRGVKIVPPKKVMENPEGSSVTPAKTTEGEAKPEPMPKPSDQVQPQPVPTPEPIKQARVEAPSVNFKVTFEFNSVRLTADARQVLDNLGAALVSDDLKPFRFRVAGHTDAKGSRAYNKALSEKRAAAVRRYLVETFRMNPARLETVGHGEDQLLDPADPNSASNRRVQITNLGPY